MRTPLFLTKAGREDVKKAKEILRDPNAGGKKIAEAVSITRRDFFEKISSGGAGVVLASAGGLFVASHKNNRGVLTDTRAREKPQNRVEKFFEIARQLERSGLAEVQWNHLKQGAKDPIFIVPFTHEDLEGRIVNESHTEALYRELQILFHLADNGVLNFAIEGYPSDEEVRGVQTYLGQDGMLIPVFDSSVPPDAGDRLAHDQARNVWAHSDVFKALLEQYSRLNQVPHIGRIFAGCVPRTVRIRGAEDPEIGAELRHLHKTLWAPHYQRMQAIVQAVNEDVENNRRLNMSFSIGDNDTLQVHIGGKQFECRTLQKDLEIHIDELKDPSPDHPLLVTREKYVADELRADAVLFGADHMQNFMNMSQPSRSLGIIKHGLAVQYESSKQERIGDMELVLKLLQEGMSRFQEKQSQ